MERTSYVRAVPLTRSSRRLKKGRPKSYFHCRRDRNSPDVGWAQMCESIDGRLYRCSQTERAAPERRTERWAWDHVGPTGGTIIRIRAISAKRIGFFDGFTECYTARNGRRRHKYNTCEQSARFRLAYFSKRLKRDEIIRRGN